MKVSFCTLGCKVNQYETNAVIQKFEASGFQIVPWGEYADIFVVNTCTVTNIADRKSRQMLRRAKKINKNGIVVAIGCYIQADRDILNKEVSVDIALGTDDKNSIVEIVEQFIKNKENKNFKFKVSDIMKNMEYIELGITKYTDTNRAYVKIEDGCEQYCTYCIIPYVRGRVRSRDKENIFKEVKVLVENGIKEIVLTGIHIASYGKDFKNEYGLIDLIEDLNNISGLERIRLSSIEPTYFTEDILKRMSKINKLCNFFHLSLQSASNNILKKMNRKYTIEEYMNIIKNIRRTFKDVILTTDIIVGFPGETEDDFNITYENLKKLRFYKIHVFKYSRRKGTIADKMDDQLTDAVKTKRSNKILELSDKYMEEYMKSYVKNTVEVLFEEIKEGYLIGHTSNYILIYVNIESLNLNEKNVSINNSNYIDYINIITEVEITEYKDLKLYGVIKDNN